MRMVKVSDVLFLVGTVLAGAAVSLWLAVWSPDALLRDPLPLYRQAKITTASDEAAGRRIDDVVLLGPSGERVAFTVSLPLDRSDEKFPSLVVVSPHHDARRNLSWFPRPGKNVIVSYAQPYDSQKWEDSSVLERAWIGRRVAYSMPDSVSALVAWVGRQEWADRKRINLAGAGLASVIVPAARRRAAISGQSISGLVLAYGGVDIERLAEANLAFEQGWIRRIAAWAVWVMLRPLEPATHLPEISGPFLLINAKDDSSIPASSLNGLHAVTPEPKTIATVGERNGDTPEHISRTVRVARNWLVSQGLLNP